MRSNIAPEPGETIDFIVAPLSRDASGRQVASAAPRSRGASFLGVARSLSFHLLLPLLPLHVAPRGPPPRRRAPRARGCAAGPPPPPPPAGSRAPVPPRRPTAAPTPGGARGAPPAVAAASGISSVPSTPPATRRHVASGR